MTANANPELFSISDGLVVRNVKINCHRLGRTAQFSRDGWERNVYRFAYKKICGLQSLKFTLRTGVFIKNS